MNSPDPAPDSPAAAPPPHRVALRTATQVAAVYGLLAAAWTVWARPVPTTQAVFHSAWFFVVLTALLLFGLLYALVRRLVGQLQQTVLRERAALRLHERNLRWLQAVADNSPDVIFAKDRQGRYELFNRAATAVSKRPASGVLGQHDSALFAPEQAAIVCANDERVMRLDAPQTFEEVIDTASGRITFLSTKGPLHDAQGQVVGMFGISRDITQRLAAQAELLASHDRLRDVLARVGDGFMSIDNAQCFTYVNPSAVRFLARQDESELIGRHLLQLFPAVLGTAFHGVLLQAMASQQPALDASYLTPTGRWLEGRLYPGADGLSIYFTDATTRRRAEQALRVSEQRYRLAVAQGQMWDWDVQRGEVTFSPAFWQLFDMATPPAGEVTRCFIALLHSADLALWREALRAHLTQRKPYALEFRARAGGPGGRGEWRWLQTRGQAVWGDDGRATYMAGTTFDITDRKAAEAALGAAEAYRSSLFEQLADAVLLTDAQHQIIDANPQARALLGFSRDERIASFEVALPLAATGCDDANAMPGAPRLAESVFLHKDGRRIDVEVNTRAIEQDRFLTVVRDVSARRASDQALHQLQAELSQLTQRLLIQEKLTTQRVAQALHDRLGQTLAVARLNLDACIVTHADAMPLPLRAQAQKISNLLDLAVQEVRLVLVDLRPPLLEDLGLLAALDNDIGTYRSRSAGPDVLLEVADNACAQRWPAEVEYAAFMVAREAITNALQHAQASLVRVLVDGDAQSLQLAVIDDGQGIPLPMLGGRPGHLGVVGMRERAHAIGARFAVAREVAGGTSVRLTWGAGGAGMQDARAVKAATNDANP